MLFLCPWNSSFALAIPGGVVVNGLVSGGVTCGGGGGNSGGLLRLLVLREIVHADALPHRIDLDSDSKKHDLGVGIVAVGGGLRAEA